MFVLSSGRDGDEPWVGKMGSREQSFDSEMYWTQILF